MSKERDINKVCLVGRLGGDPKYRTGTTGTPMASVSVYTTARWKDASTSEMKEKNERHNIVLFNGHAAYARDYLRKGARVYVDGRLQTRKYQDSVTQLDRYITEVVASEIVLLEQPRDIPAVTASQSGETADASNNADTGGDFPS